MPTAWESQTSNLENKKREIHPKDRTSFDFLAKFEFANIERPSKRPWVSNSEFSYLNELIRVVDRVTGTRLG